MKKLAILSSVALILFSGPGFQAEAQEGVAPGTVAAIAKNTSYSDFQNWIFALGALFSVTAGILLTSWDPGSGAQNH